MTARCRSHPETPVRPGFRLPWWGVVLPVAAFVALLLMAGGPARAHAATTGGTPAGILAQLHLTLSP